MILYTIPAVLSLLIIAAAVLIITIAMRRFLKGEFRQILKWLVMSFWFMALPYSLFVFREIRGDQCMAYDEISWVIYICMVIVGLGILKAAMLLNKFSKVYGFADKD
jgi:hypothetical protein